MRDLRQNHDTIDTGGARGHGTGVTLDDFELRAAVPAVETGTLNRSAAILRQAGFASRLAAIKAVQDAEGNFHSARELEAWLKSERVEQLSAAGNWPSTETAEMWSTFRASYTPPVDRTWKKSSATVSSHNEGLFTVIITVNNGRQDLLLENLRRLENHFAGTRPAISQVTCGLAQRKAYRRNCVMAGTYAVVSSNRTTCQHGPS